MDPSRILIGCALRTESRALRSRLHPATTILTTGLGTERTASCLRRHFDANRPGIFIFTGTAGQLDPKLNMGEVVFPGSWQTTHGPFLACHTPTVSRLRTLGWKIEGTGLTVGRPVLSARERLRLFRTTGALICDMETAAAFQEAAAADVPSLALKVVSDTAKSSLTGFWNHLETNLTVLVGTLNRLIQDVASILDSEKEE